MSVKLAYGLFYKAVMKCKMKRRIFKNIYDLWKLCILKATLFQNNRIMALWKVFFSTNSGNLLKWNLAALPSPPSLCLSLYLCFCFCLLLLSFSSPLLPSPLVPSPFLPSLPLPSPLLNSPLLLHLLLTTLLNQNTIISILTFKCMFVPLQCYLQISSTLLLITVPWM